MRAVYIEYIIEKDITKVVACINAMLHIDVSFRRIQNPEWSRLLNSPDSTTESINGVTVIIKMLPGNYIELYHNHTNSLAFRKKFLKAISDKMQQIFPTNQFKLKVDNRGVPAKTLFSLLQVLPKEFESFVSENDSMVIEDDMMTRILKDYTIHRLNVAWKHSPHYRYGGPLKHKYMECFHGSWVTIDAILQLECVNFQANFTTLCLYDCNRFLKSWFTGGFLELQKLELYLSEPQVDYDFVLAGVPWHPWDSEARPRDLNKFRDSLEEDEVPRIAEGVDVVRSDGKMGTVYLTRMFFNFYVWN